MEHSPDQDGGRREPSRREFIRRAATIAGLSAWAVPVVQMARGGHGSSISTDAGVIGVQAVTSACTTCVVSCESVTLCGSNGALDCFCAPGAAYPLTGCICASDVFCDEAIPCSAGCPDGWACVTACCDVPICVPPCPTVAPLAVAPKSARSLATSGRLTASGKRL
jgi:hypothetical protein